MIPNVAHICYECRIAGGRVTRKLGGLNERWGGCEEESM